MPKKSKDIWSDVEFGDNAYIDYYSESEVQELKDTIKKLEISVKDILDNDELINNWIELKSNEKILNIESWFVKYEIPKLNKEIEKIQKDLVSLKDELSKTQSVNEELKKFKPTKEVLF